MLVLDDILIGVLTSAILTLADRHDKKVAEADREALEQLKAQALRLNSPEERCLRMVDQTLRDEYALDGVAPKIADATSGDPVLASELVAWLLEAHPDRHIEGRRNLGEQLAAKIKAEQKDVDAFLQKLADRMYSHFELTQLRQDGKLNIIFRQLQELTDLEATIQAAFLNQAAMLQGIIEEHSISILHPVKPNPRPASKDNTLLSGGRPSDRDIDEDIDFRRTQFEPVMRAIFKAKTLPASFVFHADNQRGKTTFLKRVGWELARSGYPVLQLSSGAHSEPYAEWAVKHAVKESDKPLVLLIDDPFQTTEHFQGQMNVFHENSAPVIVLIASRPEDWANMDKDRAPLIRRAVEFDLNPKAHESEAVVNKLRQRGLIDIDEDQMATLLEEIDTVPFSKGYFGEVIRIASRDEYKPMPVLIAEHLEKCDDPNTVEAFRKAYRYICVPGLVGMSLPDSVYRLLVPKTMRELVRRFVETMPIPPIREVRK